MGREGPGDFEVGADVLPVVEGEDLPFTTLMDLAAKARPELSQLEAQLRSQQQTLGSIEGAFWPSLGVSTGLSGGGQNLTALAGNWSAQATLSWPLFQGFQTRSQVSEVEANLAAMRAQRDGLRQQIALELEQARLSVETARLALVSAEEALGYAKELLSLAEGRYETGAGTILELADAQTGQTKAAGQRVKADFDLAVARALLIKALGRP